MPVTATFQADFTKWNAALKDATRTFQPLEVAAKGVNSQLQKMAESFSGKKIIQQAELAVAAMGKIENVTKLTQKEQSALNATLTEAIAKYKALGQSAPADMVALQKATEAAANAQEKNGLSLKTLVGGYVAGLATFEAAKRAIGGIADFLEDSVQSYAHAEAANKRLANALKNTGNGTPQVIAQYDALAAQFQKTTTFSDDLITEMEALFTQVGEVGPAQMKGALTAATDLAEGLGIDLQTAVEAVAKAAEGQTKALHKLAPSLSDAALKGGDLNEILAEIEKHFGGSAAAQLDTYQGRIKQLANEWDNVKEAIGGAIANDDVLRAALRGITDGFRNASKEQEQFSLTQLVINQLLDDGNVVFAEAIIKLNEYAKAANNVAVIGRLLKAAKLETPDVDEKTVSVNEYADALKEARKAIAALTAEDKKAITAGTELHVKDEDLVKSLNEQHAGLKFTTGALNLYTDGLKKAATALKESEPEKLRKKLEELSAALDGAEASHISMAAVVEHWGNEVKSATTEAAAFGVAVPANVQKVQAAVDALDFSKVMEHIHEVTVGFSKELDTKFWEEQGKHADDASQEVMKAFKSMTKAHEDMEDAIAKRTLTATEFQLREIEKQRKAQIAALDPNVLGPLYGKAVDAINKQAEDLTRALIHQGELQAEAAHRNLIQQLVDARNTGRDMVASHLFTTKEIEHQQAQSRLALKAIQETFGKDWKKVLEKMGIDWHALENDIGKSWTHTLHDNLLGAVKDLGESIPQTIVQGILEGSSGEQIGEAVASQIGSALGGALGAAIGGPIGEAIGKTLGATLGPLLDKIFHNTAERLQSSVLHDFGVTIGEDLGKAIADSAASEFKGSFQAAQIGNLDKIISAGGGITIANLGKLEDRLHDVFSLMQTGELTGAQAQDILNKNFQTFVDFLGGDVDPALKEIIRLNKEFGTQSKAILDFVAKNASLAASGFNKIVANLGAIPGTLNRIGPIAEATFGALLDGGKSVVDALAEMGPGLDAVQKALKDAGQSATGFLSQILGWQSIVGNNKAIFDSLSGVLDVMKGLNNAGALTNDAFAQLAATVDDAFNALLKQGVSAGDAIKLMQPQLQEIWELEKDFGFSVDAATQALIDQAVAAGDVGEKHRSIQEQMLDLQKQELAVLEAIGKAFGVTIPDDISKTGKAVDRLGTQIDNTVAQFPKEVHIPVRFDIPKFPDNPNPSQGSTVPLAAGGPVYASGGFFTPRGTDTVPAMLTPGEFVVSRRGVSAAGMPALRSINNGVAPSGGGNVTTVNVYVQNKLDHQESKRLAEAIAPHIPGVVANGGATHSKFKRMTKALAS